MSLPYDPDWEHKWRWQAYRLMLRAYLRLVRWGPLRRLAEWFARRNMTVPADMRCNTPQSAMVSQRNVRDSRQEER